MKIDLFEVENAMNLIKEEVVKDLSESVIKQANENPIDPISRQSFFYEID